MLTGVKSRIISVILLVAIFILGLVSGVFLGQSRLLRRRAFAWHRPDKERILKFITRRYQQKLKLSPQQQKELEEILKNNRARIDALAEKVRPEFEKIRNTTNQEIKNILNAEQKSIFEEMLRKQKNFDIKQRYKPRWQEYPFKSPADKSD